MLVCQSGITETTYMVQAIFSNGENFFRKDIDPMSKKKEIFANFEKEAKKEDE